MNLRHEGPFKFYVRSRSDNFIAGEIFHKNVHQVSPAMLREVKAVIDIGGHIGLFTLFASQFNKNIYTYEPHPENYQLACDNLKLNHVSVENVYNAAVSDTNNKKMLFQSSRTTARHTLLEPPYLVHGLKQQPYKKVDCYTLSDIVIGNQLEAPLLVKLDCEGSEYAIILQTPPDVLSKIKYITMELHLDSKMAGMLESMVEYLQLSGFRVIYQITSSRSDFDLGTLFAVRDN